MPREKDPERIYYEKLFDSIDIPFIMRSDKKLYFINPITGRENDVNLQNLRRSVDQMIEDGMLQEEVIYDNLKENKNSHTFSSLLYLKENKGKLLRIVIYKNDTPICNITNRIPESGFHEVLMNMSRFNVLVDNEKSIIPINCDILLNYTYKIETFIIEEINEQNKEEFKYFILQPIKKWSEDCYVSSKSKSAKKRYMAKIRKIENLKDEYKNGVSEKDLQVICKSFQVDIKINFPLNINNPFLYCKSTKKPLKIFVIDIP